MQRVCLPIITLESTYPLPWSFHYEHVFLMRHTFKNIFNPKNTYEDFPGGAVVKNPPANAVDMGSSPGPGRSHMPWSN